MNDRKATGATGEKIAARLLKNSGYKIVVTNFLTKFGEIDIVAIDGDTLVFVEVKARRGRVFGLPEEAVSKRKLRHIEKAAQIFRNTHNDLPEAERVDVVAIEFDTSGKVAREEILKNAHL